MIGCWKKYSGRGWIAMIALSDETSSTMISYRSSGWECGVYQRMSLSWRTSTWQSGG
jgi:hypothetical protein